MMKSVHDNLMHSLSALSTKIKGKKKYKGFFPVEKSGTGDLGLTLRQYYSSSSSRNISFDKDTISGYFINHCVLARCHHCSSSTKSGKHCSTTNAI